MPGVLHPFSKGLERVWGFFIDGPAQRYAEFLFWNLNVVLKPMSEPLSLAIIETVGADEGLLIDE